MAIKNNKLKLKHKRVYILILVLIVLAIGVPTYMHHKDKQTAKIITSTNTTPKNSTLNTKKSVSSYGTNQPSQSSQAGTSDKSGSSATSTSNAQLISPFGVFVSNHSPSLSGAAIYQSEQSVCNTTPGASCYIEFTQGSEIKQLAAQTVNSQGATYWTWNVNAAGLTQGTWQITAIASLNGTTMSSQDSNNLKVQP